MIVRPIEEKDLATCIHLGARMHEESDFRDMEYSPEKCAALGRQAMTDPDYVWLVAEDGGEIVGMFGGYVSETFFGHGRVACDYAAYVKPESRGGRAFLLLVRVFVKWAEGKGVQKIILADSTKNGKIGPLYERLGFINVGGIYRRTC